MSLASPLSDRAKGARTAALAERYVLGLVIIEAGLVGLHMAFGQHPFFNLDREYNLCSWFSSLQLFTLGGACVAAFHRDGRVTADRWLWWILALGCCYLSLDEIVAIHEGVVEETIRGLPAGSLLRGLPPWQIVFAPALAIAALTFSGIFASRFVERPACWVPAAIGLALWGSAFALSGTAVFVPAALYEVEVALEEFMEMAGATLLLLGIARYVASVEPGRIGPQVSPWKRRLVWSVPITVVLVLPVSAIMAVSSHARVSALPAAGHDAFPDAPRDHPRGLFSATARCNGAPAVDLATLLDAPPLCRRSSHRPRPLP